MHALSGGSLREEAMTEDGDGQEDEAVDVDHVPPQRLLRGVRQLLFQLGFFLFRQFDLLVLFQPAEAHDQPFAQTWWFWVLCDGRGNNDEEKNAQRLCARIQAVFTLPSRLIDVESSWLLTQSSTRSSLSSSLFLKLQTRRYNWKMRAHEHQTGLLRMLRASESSWVSFLHLHACRGSGRSGGRCPG